MNIGILTQIQASILYLLPVAIVLLWLADRRTLLADLIVWIPGAIAFDLSTCLVACWVLPLDAVFLSSRLVWFTVGLAILRRRKWRIGWSTPPSGSQVASIVVAGAMAFLLSASISRSGSIWDRPFHVPLVAMLRHQRLPFLTVFQFNTVLHYHFAGNVIAAALQVFSIGRIHASLALALMHDLVFMLVGMSVAAWLSTMSPRRLWVVLGALAVLFSGPFALQRIGMGPITGGYSFLSLLCMSYRPGIATAILFLVGGFGALGLMLFGPNPSPGRTMGALFSCMAMLAISDEPSAVLLGVGIGAVWLVHPAVLHPNRKIGFPILIGLAATVLVSNIAFQAALVPGGPVQNLHLVPFRSPGYVEGPLLLTTSNGMRALVLDLAPFLLIMAAAVGVSRGRRDEPVWNLTIFLGATLLAAVLGLTVLDLNGRHIENHRFMTICEVVFPIAALVFLTHLPAGRWERVPLLGALLIPAVSSFYWAQYGVGDPDLWFTNPVDCRESANAVLFERPRPTYVPSGSLYAFSGCRPLFFPGSASGDNGWSGLLANGYPSGGKPAFETLHHTFVRTAETLRAACPNATDGDPVCSFARSHGRCQSAGKAFVTCELTRADRERLLGMSW